MQLQRRHTLKRAREFAYVRNRGLSCVGRYFVLTTAPIPPTRAAEPAFSRFGIIVTKRVGCAVLRNTMRRRVRELLRAHGESLGKGRYVVILLRQAAAGADFPALREDFSSLLARHAKQEQYAPQTSC